MINEISNKGHSTPYPASDVEERTGDNMKEAFVALLQGIVGLIPGRNALADVVETPKITDERTFTSNNESGEKKDAPRFAAESAPGTSESVPLQKDSQEYSVEKEKVPSQREGVSKNHKPQTEASSEKELPQVVKADASLNDSLKTEFVKSESLKVESSAVSEKSVATEKPASAEAVSSKVDTAVVSEDLPQDVLPAQVQKESTAALASKQGFAEEKTVSADTIKDTMMNISRELQKMLPEEDSEIKHDLAKALFNMSLAQEHEGAAAQPLVQTPKNELAANLHPFLAMSQDAVQGDLKSLLGLKPEVDSIATIGKGVSDKLHTLAKSMKGEAGTPARQQMYVEQVKEVLARMAQSKTTDSVTVKIDPPHLGEITVRIVQKGKEVYAKLSADSSEVEQVLRTRMHELSNILQHLGYKADEVHVTIGKDAEDTPRFSRSFSEHQGGNWGTKEDKKSFVMGAEKGSAYPAAHAISSGIIEDGWVA